MAILNPNYKSNSLFPRFSIIVSALFLISVLIIASIAEVSARGRGGGGGRSFSGGGRSGSGSLRYSGRSSYSRSSYSRSTQQQQRYTGGNTRQPSSRDRSLDNRQQDRYRDDFQKNRSPDDRRDHMNQAREDRQDFQRETQKNRQSYHYNRSKERQEFAEDHYYRGGYYRRGYGGGVVIGTTIAVLPTNCASIYSDGTRYYSCNNVYYRPYYQGGSTVYVVVNRP